MANPKTVIGNIRKIRDSITKNARELDKEFEKDVDLKKVKKLINKGFKLDLGLIKCHFLLKKIELKMAGKNSAKAFEEVFDDIKGDVKAVIKDAGLEVKNKIAFLRKFLKEKL